jgi:hypothetical protein
MDAKRKGLSVASSVGDESRKISNASNREEMPPEQGAVVE